MRDAKFPLQSFSAKIFIIGVNPYTLVPKKVLDELFKQARKSKGAIPICGTLNGKKYVQTLVKYSGKWRFYLNTPMRKSAGIDVGDRAHVKMKFDSRSREIIAHPNFLEALKNNVVAKNVFEKLTPSRRKEIVRYIGFLKTEESRQRNIKKVMQHLLGNARFAGRD